MKRLLLLTALALGTLVSRAADIPLSAFDGTWVIEKGEFNGAPIPPDMIEGAELEVTGGKYVFRSPNSTAKGMFKLDNTKSPVWMNIHEDEGPNAGKDIEAVTELTPTGWKAAYAFQSDKRPAALKTEADSGHALLTYKRKPGTEPKARPLRALLISGGCCHDYPGQDKILSEGISARANVQWTIVRDEGQTGTKHKISAYQKPNWSEGYDIVVHNECFSDEKELDWLEGIVKPHREGLPAVVIHCAMHCYRAPTNDWFKFVGVTSHGHGSHFAYPMTNVKPEHPIMKTFPAIWQTPKEELYNITSVEKTATPLATGYSPETKRGEANVWINTFGKGRVFGTTVGHYNETMSQTVYLDMLARGFLWAAGKLDANGEPVAGYGPAK